MLSPELPESALVPYALSPVSGERILVLSPHPDDETLGCGGTIRLLVEARKHVKVVFLTSGDKADPGRLPAGSGDGAHLTDYAARREREARRALRVLGVGDYEFLRFPDRGLHACYTDVLGKLSEITREFLPDTVYSPSMVELNPDHRSTAAAATELLKRSAQDPGIGPDVTPMMVFFYEVATPLRPNVLIDITPAYGRKKRAIGKYRSQLKLLDYLRHITALNTVRALTVTGARHVEAFWRLDRPLSDEEAREWLSYREPLG